MTFGPGVPVASCSCGLTWISSGAGIVGIASMRQMVRHWEQGHRLMATNQPGVLDAIVTTAEVYARNRAKLDAVSE